MSSDLYNCLQDVNVTDDGANLSDHFPVELTVVFTGLDYNTRCINPVSAPSKAMLSLRWDKADLAAYYDSSYQLLSAIAIPWCLLDTERFTDGVLAEYLIDSFYRNIVNALSESARVTVPSCKQNYFKFWWDEQCQLLKKQSISTHRDWLAAGKPREGPVASAMWSAKAEYKLYYLKHMRMEEHNHFTNDLHVSLAPKNVQSFWKSINSKLSFKILAQRLLMVSLVQMG